MENTADRLRQLMNERGLRQVDVIQKATPYCEQLGIKITKSEMSHYLSGRYKPSQFKLMALGQALNVSEAWLMGLDVPRDRNVPSTATLRRRELIARVNQMNDTELDRLEQILRIVESAK